jgi:hypothetical protein
MILGKYGTNKNIGFYLVEIKNLIHITIVWFSENSLNEKNNTKIL